MDEDLANLDRVVNNSLINAVTEMPPTMSDAYEDSIENDKNIEDALKETDSEIKDEPFLGASKQPVPEKIKEPKSVLEEALFEDWNSDYDDLEWREWKKDELINKDRNTWDETDWDAWYYINNEEAEKEFDEDYSSSSNRYYTDRLFKLIDDGKITKDSLLHDLVYDYLTEEEIFDYMDSRGILEYEDEEYNQEEIEEHLNEDGRQSSGLKKYSNKDNKEEEVDLWTCVYSSLTEKPEEVTGRAAQKKNTVILPKKQRYKVINTDVDGNIVVHGKTDADLDPARKVADFYNLEYSVKEAPTSMIMRYPEKRFSLTIKIPEDAVYNPDK